MYQSSSKKDKHYTLGSLWLFLKFKENLKDYYIQTQQQNIEIVESNDREKIIDFFIKDIDNVDILDNEIRPKTIITLGKKKKGDNLDSFYKDKSNPEENKKKRKIFIHDKTTRIKR
jgi:hypothetical protein